MDELHHECGIAAIYHLPKLKSSRSRESGSTATPISIENSFQTSRLIPGLLLEIQNRGQLAAGMSVYQPHKPALLKTYKGIGKVPEVFHLGHEEEAEKLLSDLAGPAAIGHVRYATCGKDDPNYAQPFERTHGETHKWFAFGFNGQLANYLDLKTEILSQKNFHLVRDTDTEVLMYLLAQQLSGDREPTLHQLLTDLAKKLDGAYNIAFLNARGDMFVARDPLGFHPLCFAIQDGLFVAASESVALYNMGFEESAIQTLPPGHAVIIENGTLEIRQFAESPRRSHCFFEWIYFANVASTLDDRSVYLTRKSLGEELARDETVDCSDGNTIVVPVPDTAKAAADAMAYALRVPCLEGLIRNRYVGRTFIEGKHRAAKARMKYTPLREVLEGKRILLVDDTIVRSTTMQTLIKQLKERGKAKEVHVRVACPPIIAPCFYGIDMTSVKELFAPKFFTDGQPNFLEGGRLSPEIERKMAEALGADSLRYLPVPAISSSINTSSTNLCQACVDGHYPTPTGSRLYQISLTQTGDQSESSSGNGRIFDGPVVASR